MYSTSSSACECDDEYCICNNGADAYENPCSYERSPFYPTMGHPIVYYAQVPQQPNMQRNRESRKDNKNCFSKAFRWYTQEHVPQRSISPNKTDMSAFAVWLDSKYDEFLRDSQLDSVYHPKVKQTGIYETDRIPNNTRCDRRSNKFRVKSPWRRKRRNGSKEAGDAIQKQNQSFHYILQPKDLTQPASESRQPSNSTMISTGLPMKYTIKSQSYTLMLQKPADCTICEGKTQCETDKSNRDISDEKKSQHKPLQNISCQCSSVKVVKTNVQSQYEYTDAERACDNRITPAETSSLCQSHQNNTPNNETSKAVLTTKEVQPKARNVQLATPSKYPNEQILKADSQIQNLTQTESRRNNTPNNETSMAVLTTRKAQPKSHNVQLATLCKCTNEPIVKADSQIQYLTKTEEHSLGLSKIQSSTKIHKTCPCTEDEFVENVTHAPYQITFSDGGVQTSNLSIHIEKDGVHGYPLFMKIVCADKLCK